MNSNKKSKTLHNGGRLPGYPRRRPRTRSRSRSRSRYQIMNLPERPTPAQIRNFNDEELRAAVIHLLQRVAGPFTASSGDSARRIWVRRLVEHMEQIR